MVKGRMNECLISARRALKQELSTQRGNRIFREEGSHEFVERQTLRRSGLKDFVEVIEF